MRSIARAALSFLPAFISPAVGGQRKGSISIFIATVLRKRPLGMRERSTASSEACAIATWSWYRPDRHNVAA